MLADIKGIVNTPSLLKNIIVSVLQNKLTDTYHQHGHTFSPLAMMSSRHARYVLAYFIHREGITGSDANTIKQAIKVQTLIMGMLVTKKYSCTVSI